ncbi:MAG: hypothetical protein MN733_17345 [Nitrososphaera sp.]|nr:hypothetical protein [Nitrososphaera sp.]
MTPNIPTIQDRIARMNPAARKAARNLTIRLLKDPSILLDQEEIWAEQYGVAVLNVAISVSDHIQQEKQRREKKKERLIKVGKVGVVAAAVAAVVAWPPSAFGIPFLFDSVRSSSPSPQLKNTDRPVPPGDRELTPLEKELLQSFFGEGGN